MRRQRNMVQMKEQIKTPEKELNEMEISNLSDVEFKTLVIRMLKELSKDLKSIKKIQSEIKDTLIKIKNNVQGNNSRVDEAENQPMIWNIRKQNTDRWVLTLAWPTWKTPKPVHPVSGYRPLQSTATLPLHS